MLSQQASRAPSLANPGPYSPAFPWRRVLALSGTGESGLLWAGPSSTRLRAWVNSAPLLTGEVQLSVDSFEGLSFVPVLQFIGYLKYAVTEYSRYTFKEKEAKSQNYPHINTMSG